MDGRKVNLLLSMCAEVYRLSDKDINAGGYNRPHMSSSETSSSESNQGLFGDSIEDQRRSILFALGIITGFIATTAMSAVVVSEPHIPTIVVLIVLAALSFGFAGFVYLGRFDSLVADDQLLWKVFNAEEDDEAEHDDSEHDEDAEDEE
jgi:membrane glycosyltransferase